MQLTKLSLASAFPAGKGVDCLGFIEKLAFLGGLDLVIYCCPDAEL
jgi:hypothetical protein